jgi:hypothetical protein
MRGARIREDPYRLPLPGAKQPSRWRGLCTKQGSCAFFLKKKSILTKRRRRGRVRLQSSTYPFPLDPQPPPSRRLRAPCLHGYHTTLATPWMRGRPVARRGARRRSQHDADFWVSSRTEGTTILAHTNYSCFFPHPTAVQP